MGHELASHWRLKEQRYRLIGEICQNYGCGEKIFPPRDTCPHCGQLSYIKHEFSGKGEVYSFSTIYKDAPEGYEEFVPYTVALVKLEEGPMITAQLTDLDFKWEDEVIDGETRLVKELDIEIGMPVEMVTRKLKENGPSGTIAYGYKFRPRLVPELEAVG